MVPETSPATATPARSGHARGPVGQRLWSAFGECGSGEARSAVCKQTVTNKRSCQSTLFQSPPDVLYNVPSSWGGR